MLRSAGITPKDTPSTILLRETIRPTCLAFLLASSTFELFLRAAEICSTLWGGCYDPIIILDQTGRSPLGVQEQFGDRPNIEILNTLTDFDPDFVVTIGTDTLPDFIAEKFGTRHLKEADLVQELRPGQRAGVFLEVWPFLQEFWRREVRGGPADPGIRLVTAEPQSNLESFVAAQFGRYIRESITRMMHDRLAAKDSTFDTTFRQNFEYGQFWFPIDFTQLSLDALGQAAFVNIAFFLLDATNVFDVVDYWNLRAAGMTIFPLPVAFYKHYETGVKKFAAATKLNLAGIDGEVMKARSISDELLEEVQKWLSAVSERNITRRGWYPRFGRKIDFVSPDITPVQIEASSSNQLAVLVHGYGHVMGATP